MLKIITCLVCVYNRKKALDKSNMNKLNKLNKFFLYGKLKKKRYLSASNKQKNG